MMINDDDDDDAESESDDAANHVQLLVVSFFWVSSELQKRKTLTGGYQIIHTLVEHES